MKSAPRVFLSYTHKDQLPVEKVAHLLKDRGIDVWYDEWELLVGSSLIREIQEGIRRADFVVIFFSKNSLRSQWMGEEYEASKIREVENKQKVIILPVRLDDCVLPMFMRGRVYANFRQSFTRGVTKLLQAILGEKGLNGIDRFFYRLSSKEEISHQRLQCTANEFLRRFQDTIETRRKCVQSSAQCAADFRSTENFEKWLGNTIRDYYQFKLYEDTLDFLTKEPNDRTIQVKDLLDYLFDRLNARMQSFGLPSFRYTEESIVADLERILHSFY